MGTLSFEFQKIDSKDAETELDGKLTDEIFKCQLISHLYNRFGSIEISDLYDEQYLFSMNISGSQGNYNNKLFFVTFLLHH